MVEGREVVHEGQGSIAEIEFHKALAQIEGIGLTESAIPRQDIYVSEGMNGAIFIAFGSNCDFKPFNGWVFAYDATTLAQQGAFNTTPSSVNSEGAIWMSGAGLAADEKKAGAIEMIKRIKCRCDVCG